MCNYIFISIEGAFSIYWTVYFSASPLYQSHTSNNRIWSSIAISLNFLLWDWLGGRLIFFFSAFPLTLRRVSSHYLSFRRMSVLARALRVIDCYGQGCEHDAAWLLVCLRKQQYLRGASSCWIKFVWEVACEQHI